MEERKTLTQEQAKEKIDSYKRGNFFTVTFVKRTGDKEVRTMNCRKGVTKGVNGNGLKFDPNDKSLVGVWEPSKKQHRFISLDEIHALSIDGEKYIVV